MTNYFEKIVDVSTGEETIRPYTAAEVKAVEAAKTKNDAEQAKRDAEEATKTAARQAVLDKLGLTTEEIAALLS
jgi:hypothetical protein